MEKTSQLLSKSEITVMSGIFSLSEAEEIKNALYEQFTDEAEAVYANALAGIEDINDYLAVDEAVGALCSAYEKLGFAIGYTLFKTCRGGVADE